MHNRHTSLRTGDVVVPCYPCPGRAVVWRQVGEILWLLPILNGGDVRYRADVPISEFRDMVQCAVGGTDLVVRPGKAFRAQASKQKRIGRLNDALLADLAKAVHRECAASRVEAYWGP